MRSTSHGENQPLNTTPERLRSITRTTSPSVEIAPDKEAERQFLPDPSTLKGRLLLADRTALPASVADRARAPNVERALDG
jgi:hypothetical protein